MPKILDIGASTEGVLVIVSGAASRGPVAVSAQLIWRHAKMLELPERGERQFPSRRLGAFGSRGGCTIFL